MKAKTILLFTFLLLIANLMLFAGTASGQNINPVSEFVIDVRNGATFEYEIHPSLPIFVFHLIPDSQHNVISTIEISKKGHPDIIQTLESGMGEAPYCDSDYFQAEDMNFDGYKDIKILTFWGATGNEGYNFWLFDSKKKRFVYSEALSNIANPKPNSRTKELTSFSTGGMAGNIYTKCTFKFIASDLVLLQRVRQDWIKEKKHFLKVVEERIDGVMKIVKEEIVIEEDLH